MARTDTGAGETFLVEHYRPGLTAEELGAWAARIRETTAEMEREGKRVRYLRAAIVPTDESLLCLFEAASEHLVREAYARVGIPFERITPVIPDGMACRLARDRRRPADAASRLRGPRARADR